MTQDSCYIIGSGRSLLDLTEQERDHLNAHPYTLAMNKYLLFHEKVGVVPKALFLADRGFPAQRVVVESIAIASRLKPRPRFYLNDYYRALFSWKPKALFWSVRERRRLWEDHGYWVPFSAGYNDVRYFRSGLNNDRPFFWAEELSEELYFYRGSLTTAVNLASIVFPCRNICLVGVDLNTVGCFYDDELAKMPELVDTFRQAGEQVGRHSTTTTILGFPGIQSVMPKIVEKLAGQGKRLLCCNPTSMLVGDGICEFTPIEGGIGQERILRRVEDESPRTQLGKGSTAGIGSKPAPLDGELSEGETRTVQGESRALEVVHVSTRDVTGGAARAAFRLHDGLGRLGQDSSMLVLYRASDDETIKAFAPPMDAPTRLQRRLRRWSIARDLQRYRGRRPSGYGLFTDDRCQFREGLVDQLDSADVINLHWVAEFVDFGKFFPLATRRAPVVWTLHDMNAFTGGCHYDHGCGRHRDQCGRCPQLGSQDPADLSHQIWRRKKEVFEGIDPDRLHMVTPSRWLAEETKRSSLLGRFPITTIPYGVDTDVFAPRDRTFARSALGVPDDARVMLFIAEPVGSWHKGFHLLAQALDAMPNRDRVLLISVGAGELTSDVPVAHMHLGHLNDDRLLSLVCSAADVYVIPSLSDNLPNAVLESLACGTPVVGFATGGIPDMVRSDVTGLLAPVGDVKALGDSLARLLEDPASRSAMAAHCRRVALEDYSLEVQARRYLELYRTILSHRKPSVGASPAPPSGELASSTR